MRPGVRGVCSASRCRVTSPLRRCDALVCWSSWSGLSPSSRPGKRSAIVRMCHDSRHSNLVRDHKQITSNPKPIVCSYFYAPEWTRTTTENNLHKALNLARLPIPPRAQRGASIASSALGWCSERAASGARRLVPTTAVPAIDWAAPCVRPRTELKCEHMFVPPLHPALQGAKPPWI